MLERCTPETHAAMDLILSTFGGEDGGGAYVKLCTLVEELDVRANSGFDKSAYQLVGVVLKFARLIEIAKSSRLTPPQT